MNRAEARRADKSHRKIGSKVGTTPNCAASGPCPVRVSAFEDEQVIRNTWVDCLRDVRHHFTEVKHGVNVPSNMDAALLRFSVVRRIGGINSKEMPCCLEANLNNARIVKFVDVLEGLVPLLACVIQVAASAQEAAELPRLIDLLLEGLPRAEDLAGIVDDFRLPFCLCSECIGSYHGVPTVFQCRHCYSILEIGKRLYLPEQYLE